MKATLADLIISSDGLDFVGAQKYQPKPIKKVQKPIRRMMARKINAPDSSVFAKRVGL